MKYIVKAVAGLLIIFLTTACSVPLKQPVLHDFGLLTPISTYQGKQNIAPTITVDAPTWLWDNRIRYRLLYAPKTRIGFYALDLWIASPPELFEQQLLASGKFQNFSIKLSMHTFEQQFLAPHSAKVVLRFSVQAYSENKKRKLGFQEFSLEHATITADAAGAVTGFTELTQQAVDKIQKWLSGLSDKPLTADKDG